MGIYRKIVVAKEKVLLTNITYLECEGVSPLATPLYLVDDTPVNPLFLVDDTPVNPVYLVDDG